MGIYTSYFSIEDVYHVLFLEHDTINMTVDENLAMHGIHV